MQKTDTTSRATEPSFNYGGQAVIEGVMMRGSKALAVAVRNPAGDIVVHTEPLNKHIYDGRVARLPFLRGLTLLWDALGLGIKSLMFSAEIAVDEEEENNEEAGKIFEGPMQIGTVLFSLTFSILLFFVLPTFLAHQAVIWTHFEDSLLVENLIEGLVRLVLLVGYVWVIGLLPDIRRVYKYHGAEHKTINAYESGVDLTPRNVAEFPLEHPRCGTAFLLTVVVISILIYTLLPDLNLLARIISRLVLLPVIAGISYEFIKFTAVHQDNAFIRMITRPNLALQRLTTAEPDLEMLAVAISALGHVLAFEHGQGELVDAKVVSQPPMPKPVNLGVKSVNP